MLAAAIERGEDIAFGTAHDAAALMRMRELIQSPAAVLGRVIDAFGNPTEYHILKEHPGELAAARFGEYDL